MGQPLDSSADALMRETVERKLRLPWELFDALANDMESDPALCERATRAVPLRLKLCAALRHLATDPRLMVWNHLLA